MSAKRKACVVCGAAVVNKNPRCKTCDSVCGRALESGMTRSERIAYEMRRDHKKWDREQRKRAWEKYDYIDDECY